MMRPFDDHDDDEEEDDDLIIFKEKQAPDFSLSQLTQKKSQHSQSQESLFPPSRPAHRMISRHERRKRRNEWKERQRLDQLEFNATSPEFTAPETEEDAFESLKALLPDSQNITPTPKPVGQQKVKNEKENVILNITPRNLNGNVSEKIERADLEDDRSSGNLTFNTSMTNDDHEANAKLSIDRSLPKEVNETREFEPVQDEIIHDERWPNRSNQRSKGQRSRSQERGGFESDFEPLSPVRASKKRRKIRDTHDKHRDRSEAKISKRLKSGVQLGQSSKSNQRKNLRLPTPWGNSRTSQLPSVTQTQRVKSIVGLRPSSWKNEPEKPLEWKQPRASQKRSSSTSSKSTKVSTQKAPSMSQIRAKYMPQPNRKITTSSATKGKTTTSPGATSTSRSKGSGGRSKSPVSFTPSFLPTSKSLKEEDDVEEVPEKSPRRVSHTTATTTSPMQPTSPLFREPHVSSPMIPRTSHRRTRKTIGPWQRRLEALQNARSNDAIRLQNEAFRRHTSFEMNDYRKKSRSHTDITVLGDVGLRPPNGKAQDASQKLSVLVYIHSHTHHHHQEQYDSKSTQQPVLMHELAWATFTFLTARSINLQKGKQLRLYNSIILPCSQPITVEGLAIDTLPSNVCERILVSTWLCENHPEGLPKLSF